MMFWCNGHRFRIVLLVCSIFWSEYFGAHTLFLSLSLFVFWFTKIENWNISQKHKPEQFRYLCSYVRLGLWQRTTILNYSCRVLFGNWQKWKSPTEWGSAKTRVYNTQFAAAHICMPCNEHRRTRTMARYDWCVHACMYARPSIERVWWISKEVCSEAIRIFVITIPAWIHLFSLAIKVWKNTDEPNGVRCGQNI